MRAAKLRMQAMLSRIVGWLVLGAALMAAFTGPGPLVYQQYEAEHYWPSASATVKAFYQRSKYVHTSRGPSYYLYWTEFSVLLDLPAAQCPLPMRIADQCVGIYKTMETRSATDTWTWRARHPVLSTVQVYYDPKGSLGSRIFFAGEAARDVYPWRQIGALLFTLAIVGLVFFVAARNIRRADEWEARFPDERVVAANN